MASRINLEVGRRIGNLGYSGGLHTWLVLDDGITLRELFSQAEQHARELCHKRGEEFVEVMICRIEKDYTGSSDQTPFGVEL